ncbi:MAG TPA: protein kinase, partial [Gemmataceae bacterium]|nr:protein kinase [Gemmataceae bacterium]
MASVVSSDRFLDSLRQSQVLDSAELDRYLARLAAEGTPLPEAEKLASCLVRDGLLTNFQSDRLLQAKWQGFVLGGKYRLLEMLGAGGMGRVFLCEHIRMRNLVAVKVLPPGQLSEPGALERFNREARAAANLVHPNLVRCFDVDEDGTFNFLVMEYVHGTNLHDLVRKNGPLDIARAADCIRQAAEGLQYAHERGLVHRDIKPSNILLDWQGTIKVLDLGLARFRQDSRDHLTDERNGGSILGTIDYLAPEQAVSSHNVTTQADIYSLGATFYFLLTGRTLFEEGTITQKMLWHQVRQPASLRDVRPDVPAELEAVVMRMLAKEPAARQPTPATVAVNLAAWTRTPLPLPHPSDLPALCPAVQRLLPGPAPRLAPHPAAAPTGDASPSPASATDATPGSTAADASSAPTLHFPPAPRTRSRRVLIGLGAVAVAGMLSGGYFTLHLLRPPAIPPVRPADLEGF